ncbi:MAG: energy-coupling factor ABC transporter ATP-binding protein [Candidatus Promineifilaceae bacterium]
MVRLEGVSYTYPRGEQPALADLDLSIPAGQFCALIGANGAGKSSLCYALTGFIPHFYRGRLVGKVEVAGRDVAATPPAELAGQVGFVFANPFNQISGARFSVREEVAFGLENLGVPRDEMAGRVYEALQLTGLEALAERSPFELSGGEQQRLAIASVLVMRPAVLVLDEPTSQLDPAGARDVFGALCGLSAGLGTTIVLAEQRLEWVAVHAERVLALAAGHIAADGPPAEVLVGDGLEELGVAPARYTQAARLAREQGLCPAARLPVSLDETADFFRQCR